jgi:hypothetical protein
MFLREPQTHARMIDPRGPENGSILGPVNNVMVGTDGVEILEARRIGDIAGFRNIRPHLA